MFAGFFVWSNSKLQALDEEGETSLPRSSKYFRRSNLRNYWRSLGLRRSPRKAEKRPIYVLNLTVPPEEVDNCLEPAKTNVLFQVSLLSIPEHQTPDTKSGQKCCGNIFIHFHPVISHPSRILNLPSDVSHHTPRRFIVASKAEKERHRRFWLCWINGWLWLHTRYEEVFTYPWSTRWTFAVICCSLPHFQRLRSCLICNAGWSFRRNYVDRFKHWRDVHCWYTDGKLSSSRPITTEPQRKQKRSWTFSVAVSK